MPRGPRSVPGPLLAAVVLVACGGAARQTPPEDVLRRYASALEERRLADAYALLSEEARKTLSYEAFQILVRENPDEIAELVRTLRRPTQPAELTATVATPDGETLLLVWEAGAWHVDASAIDLYAQDTPASAVRAFIRAVDNRRYDVLMRFVPDVEREGLDEKRLREAFEGEQKAEVEEVTQALRAALPTAQIERIGDRATMTYGAGGTVQLVREHGAWRIEEF